MTKLNLKSKTYHEVDYRNLEAFIQETFYHPDYSFAADQECANDSVHTFSVGNENWQKLNDSEYKRVAAFKYGEDVFMVTNTLLQYLYEEGVIPAGNYLVNVSW